MSLKMLPKEASLHERSWKGEDWTHYLWKKEDRLVANEKLNPGLLPNE
ncbi:MAG: hypothetical protein LW832_08785 [Parachlamydia sp.]|nr:hypothetical protein [Parachlamydia sp.]